MPAVSITPADLEPFATIDLVKAEAMVADALGVARAIAPCIFEEGFERPDAAKAVIRGAILRWNDAATGAVTTMQAGAYQKTIDSNTRRNGMFWPSEIRDLQKLCSTGGSRRAHTVDMDTAYE